MSVNTDLNDANLAEILELLEASDDGSSFGRHDGEAAAGLENEPANDGKLSSKTRQSSSTAATISHSPKDLQAKYASQSVDDALSRTRLQMLFFKNDNNTQYSKAMVAPAAEEYPDFHVISNSVVPLPTIPEYYDTCNEDLESDDCDSEFTKPDVRTREMAVVHLYRSLQAFMDSYPFTSSHQNSALHQTVWFLLVPCLLFTLVPVHSICSHILDEANPSPGPILSQLQTIVSEISANKLRIHKACDIATDKTFAVVKTQIWEKPARIWNSNDSNGHLLRLFVYALAVLGLIPLLSLVLLPWFGVLVGFWILSVWVRNFLAEVSASD
ncbi:hypothetical protein BDR26DRAFT_862914 [Obelidium mucronatum]|nr:hypothetical protein BDR26DRAFT_862914 [Obelidium mucronatum]